MKSNIRRNNLFFWLFLSPILLALFVVVIIPLLYGFYYSFTNWNGINTPQFKGLANYSKLLKDKGFRNAV